MCISIFGQPEIQLHIHFTFFFFDNQYLNENMGFILESYNWQGYTEELYNLNKILEFGNIINTPQGVFQMTLMVTN